MKKAWIEDGRVRDVCHRNPVECYHPDVATFYDTDVPDDVVNGATLVNGVWANPPPPSLLPQPRTIGGDEVRAKLTLAENVMGGSGATDWLKTVKIEFHSPQLLPYAGELLELLVKEKIISQASADKILK